MGRGATPNNQKGNQIQMSETKQIFIPVPVPGVAGTMVQSHIDKLSDLGMYGSRSIRVWASRFDWGSQPEAKGLFPEEGKGTKLWQHTALVGQENAPEKQDYVFLVWGPDKLAHIQLTATGDKAGFSHPSFNIYSQAAARLYQDYLPLFQQWGGVPMIEWKPVGKAEALRINVSEGTSSLIPDTWKRYRYSASAAYSTTASAARQDGNHANRKSEVLWMSPHCLTPDQGTLWETL
jgi:hypothetical protein